MAEARCEREALIMAPLWNAIRDAKRGRAFDLSDFNPFTKKRRSITFVSAADLRRRLEGNRVNVQGGPSKRST